MWSRMLVWTVVVGGRSTLSPNKSCLSCWVTTVGLGQFFDPGVQMWDYRKKGFSPKLMRRWLYERFLDVTYRVWLSKVIGWWCSFTTSLHPTIPYPGLRTRRGLRTNTTIHPVHLLKPSLDLLRQHIDIPSFPNTSETLSWVLKLLRAVNHWSGGSVGC